MAYLKCSYCGIFVDVHFRNCPQCGNRLYDDTRKKSHGGGIAAVVLLVFLAVVGFFALQAYKMYQERAYEEKLRTAVYEIVMSAAESEEAGDLLHVVWYNYAYNISDPETDKYTRRDNGTGPFYEDINDVIDALFADPEYAADRNEIVDSQYDLANLMRELSDPPEKYKDDFSNLRILYSAYVEFSDIVLNPRGNYQMFTLKYNEAREKVLNSYYPLSMYMG